MVYLAILKFSFLRFFAYPFEILAEIIRSVVMVFFLVLFWLVAADNLHVPVDMQTIASYFLIATGVKEIVMADYGAFGSLLGDLIKSGKITNYFLKPATTIPSIYFTSLGRNGVVMLMAFISILAGLFIKPPEGAISIVLFFIFLAIAIAVSFAVNLFEGLLPLYSPDASGYVNVINHTIQIFSGAMIPVYFFPGLLGSIVKLTPFPAMVFGPTNALRSSAVNTEIIVALGVGVFWAVALNLFVYLFWKRSIKKYEAVGI